MATVDLSLEDGFSNGPLDAVVRSLDVVEVEEEKDFIPVFPEAVEESQDIGVPGP